MLELANTPLDGNDENGGIRATTEDPLWAFIAGPASNLARLVLSFKLGVKVGRDDLRETSKAKLLELRVLSGAYREKGVVFGRAVDGVVVPLEEGDIPNSWVLGGKAAKPKKPNVFAKT